MRIISLCIFNHNLSISSTRLKSHSVLNYILILSSALPLANKLRFRTSSTLNGLFVSIRPWQCESSRTSVSGRWSTRQAERPQRTRPRRTYNTGTNSDPWLDSPCAALPCDAAHTPSNTRPSPGVSFFGLWSAFERGLNGEGERRKITSG